MNAGSSPSIRPSALTLALPSAGIFALASATARRRSDVKPSMPANRTRASLKRSFSNRASLASTPSWDGLPASNFSASSRIDGVARLTRLAGRLAPSPNRRPPDPVTTAYAGGAVSLWFTCEGADADPRENHSASFVRNVSGVGVYSERILAGLPLMTLNSPKSKGAGWTETRHEEGRCLIPQAASQPEPLWRRS